MQALYAQCVLVDGNHVLVHDDVASGIAHIAKVVTQNQRTGHHAPHGEVGAVFVFCHAVANLQHVGIVPIALSCILTQRVVVLDALHHSELTIARENPQ